MAQKRDNSNVTVMVSSSVYGQEELLDRIYGILSNFGFEVWILTKGPFQLTPMKIRSKAVCVLSKTAISFLVLSVLITEAVLITVFLSPIWNFRRRSD